MSKEQPKRGGARPGAGRKPTDRPNRQATSIRIAPEVLDYLRSTGNQSAEIERLVKRSGRFCRWRKEN